MANKQFTYKVLLDGAKKTIKEWSDLAKGTAAYGAALRVLTPLVNAYKATSSALSGAINVSEKAFDKLNQTVNANPFVRLASIIIQIVDFFLSFQDRLEELKTKFDALRKPIEFVQKIVTVVTESFKVLFEGLVQLVTLDFSGFAASVGDFFSGASAGAALTLKELEKTL